MDMSGDGTALNIAIVQHEMSTVATGRCSYGSRVVFVYPVLWLCYGSKQHLNCERLLIGGVNISNWVMHSSMNAYANGTVFFLTMSVFEKLAQYSFFGDCEQYAVYWHC